MVGRAVHNNKFPPELNIVLGQINANEELSYRDPVHLKSFSPHPHQDATRPAMGQKPIPVKVVPSNGAEIASGEQTLDHFLEADKVKLLRSKGFR